VRGTKCFRDCVKHAFGIAQYVVVPEAQQAIAAFAQPRIAIRIAFCRSMLASISFNNEACLQTNEVRNISANRLLAAELGAFQLSRTKQSPKCAFAMRELSPEPFGQLQRVCRI